MPSQLFTLHPHFSREWLYPAPIVASLFDRFRFADPSPTTRWIVAMTTLFRPQFERLLQERDRILAPLLNARPRAPASFEIAAAIDIDVDRRIAAIDREVEHRRRGSESV